MTDRRGAQPFFSDLEAAGQNYGVLVRSSIQRGRLVDIRAPKMPDGYHLYTATDIPGENRLTVMGTTIPIFTPYEINYYGEPLGILVGPDLQTVHELVAEVLIETESLESLPFSEKFNASQVVAKRVLFSGDIDVAFTKAERVVETTSATCPQDHYYAEPLGVLVDFSEGRLVISCPSQWPFHVRTTVSSTLDLDPAEIVVKPTAIGESLDGKIWYPSLLAAQASLAAVLSKKPVKLSLTRQEDFLFTVKSAPVDIRYRSALTESGSLKAVSVRILINAGAYSPLIDEILDRMILGALSQYRCEEYRIEAWALRTSLPPMGALAGWGLSQVLFALETHLATLIASLNESPVEWKLFNLIEGGRLTLTGVTLKGANRYPELFSTLCEASQFPRKYTAYEHLNRLRSNRSDGPLRGIALVMGWQGNGFTGKTPSQGSYSVSVTMDNDGKLFISGAFHSRAIKNLARAEAARILGLEEAHIHIKDDSTETMSPSGPETLSTRLTITLPLVRKCCESLQKQRFRHPLPITVKKVFKSPRGDVWDKDSLQGTPFVSTTNAACALELSLDPHTFEPTIKNVWLAIDAGKILDKTAALSTVRKTARAALSAAMAEGITLKEGRYSPTDSVQYDIMNLAESSTIHVHFIESDDESKGIGSIAHNLVPAAYGAALYQILRKKVPAIPFGARSIWEFTKQTEKEDTR